MEHDRRVHEVDGLGDPRRDDRSEREHEGLIEFRGELERLTLTAGGLGDLAFAERKLGAVAERLSEQHVVVKVSRDSVSPPP